MSVMNQTWKALIAGAILTAPAIAAAQPVRPVPPVPPAPVIAPMPPMPPVAPMLPGLLDFEMPDIPEMPELPEMPEMPEMPDLSFVGPAHRRCHGRAIDAIRPDWSRFGLGPIGPWSLGAAIPRALRPIGRGVPDERRHDRRLPELGVEDEARQRADEVAPA